MENSLIQLNYVVSWKRLSQYHNVMLIIKPNAPANASTRQDLHTHSYFPIPKLHTHVGTRLGNRWLPTRCLGVWALVIWALVIWVFGVWVLGVWVLGFCVLGVGKMAMDR